MRRIGLAILVATLLVCGFADWFVHHPREWIEAKSDSWPRFVVSALLRIGNPVGDMTDAIGFTGSDAIVEVESAAPSGKVFFAGAPRRVGAPAPDDITIIDRGDFIVGWSPRLRHPVWCAYHVPAKARFEVGPRPGFRQDEKVPRCPTPGEYTRTNYDRGHMAPNHAIASRFGPEAQTNSFLMTNISPQTPPLNRGVWREVEHRIADLWTAKWGEIWVIVGAISEGCERLSGSDVDVPTSFYHVVVAQDGRKVRALAMLFEQEVPWKAWPARYIVSIDELERRTGLDFLPDMEDAAEESLESALPSRMWPIKLLDVVAMFRTHYYNPQQQWQSSSKERRKNGKQRYGADEDEQKAVSRRSRGGNNRRGRRGEANGRQGK